MYEPSPSRSSWFQKYRWPLILAIAGTLLRLALIVVARHHDRFYDELDYQKIGAAVSHLQGFKDGDYTTKWVAGHSVVVDGTYFTAYRAPGQIVLVAMVYAIANHLPSLITSHLAINGDLLVEIVEALLLAVLPFVCYRLGRALGLSPLAANLGAAVAAFHPALAYASTTVYPTALTTTALTLGVWYAWQCIEQNKTGRAVAAGIALAIAGAATTTFAPLAFLAAVVIALKKRYRMAVIVLIVGTLPALAWMIRNQLTLGDFVLATNGGYNLELGANDQATPRSGNWVELNPDWTRGEVYLDHVEQAEAKAWIHAHRGRYAELCVLRALAVFDSAGRPRTEGLHSNKLAEVAAYSLLPVMIFGVAGLILYRKHALAWLTVAALGLVILSSAATIAKPRFRFPCDPLLSVFALGGAAGLVRRKPVTVDQKQEAAPRAAQMV